MSEKPRSSARMMTTLGRGAAARAAAATPTNSAIVVVNAINLAGYAKPSLPLRCYLVVIQASRPLWHRRGVAGVEERLPLVLREIVRVGELVIGDHDAAAQNLPAFPRA